MNDELIKLIEAIVDKKLKSAKLDIRSITGGGGDTIISSMRNIHLQPGIGYTAKYKGVELGTGGGGAVSSVFGRTGAVTAQSGDYSAYYLLLTAGSGAPLTGDLYIDKTTPGLVLKNAGTIKGYVQATATEFDIYPNAVPMSLGDLGQILYGRGSSVIFKTAVGDVTRLTIADALITSTVDLTIDKGTPGLILKNSGTIKGYVQATATEFDVYPSGVKMSLGDGAQLLDLYGSTIALYGTVTINNSTLITNLNADLLDGSHASAFATSGHTHSTYLLLTAGSGQALTGDLYIDKATPGIVLKNSTVIKGYVQATSTEFDVYPSGVPMSLGDLGQVLYSRGSSIIFKTAVGDVTRLTIADAAITAAVPLAMGSNAITTSSTVDGVDVSAIPSTYLALAGGAMTGDVSFTDGAGIDLRNDNVHKIAYVSGTNSMDISSYTIINMKTTVDSNTPLSIASDGVRLGEALFFRKNHADDLTYIVDDATGNMEFHVGAGDVFKFIVG